MRKEEADKNVSLIFDNPKTNLTYEKNLYLNQTKYRAKPNTNIFQAFHIKK